MRRRWTLAIVLILGIMAVGLATRAAEQTSPPVAAQMQEGFLFCPPPGGWAMSVWLGPNDTPTTQAVATCLDVLIRAVWYFNVDTQDWEGYSLDPDVPEIARGTLTTLFHLQPVLLLGWEASPTLLSLSPTPPTALGYVGAGPLSDSSYVDSQGRRHVVGEVKNNQLVNIHNVTVIASFLNTSGSVVAQTQATPCIDTVPAGGDSPFHIVLTNPPAGLASHVLAVTSEPTELPPSSGLALDVTTARLESQRSFRVDGLVTNRSAVTKASVKLCAALYDSAGNVVWSSETLSNPSSLVPGQSGGFSFAESIDWATPVGYRLWVQGQGS